MKLLAVLWCSVGAILAKVQNVAQDIPGIEKTDIGIGCDKSYYSEAADENFVKKFDIGYPGAAFIAVHFEKFNLPPGDFVVIKSSDGEQMVSYGSNQRGDFVADAIFSSNITVELKLNQSMTWKDNPYYDCLGFLIDSFRYAAVSATHEDAQEETTCGEDDAQNAACFNYLPNVVAASKSIIRLIVHKPTGSFYCTGWLLGCENHVMTNEHCIADQSEAKNVQFEFMAQGDKCSTLCTGGGRCPGKVEAKSAILIAVSKEHDYALLKLNTDTDLNQMYGYLMLRAEGPKLNERIFIAQHPGGWGKQVVLKSDGSFARITTLSRGGCTPDQAGYFADTRGGSSGSPVIAVSDNKVVALHHCGGKW